MGTALIAIWLIGIPIFMIWIGGYVSPLYMIEAYAKDPRSIALALFVALGIAAMWPYHLFYAVIDYINQSRNTPD